MEQLQRLFRERPEAWNFILLYFEYAHLVDDLIDEGFDLEKFVRCNFLASLIYSSDYLNRNRSQILPVMHTTLNTYADSVKWEKTEGMQKHADTLRHCGLDVILKVVQLEFGWDALRGISGIVREWNFNQ